MRSIPQSVAVVRGIASDAGPSDVNYDKAFAKVGAIRVTTWEELLDTSLALGPMPPLHGDHVVMITNGGGSGLLACDDFERRGMPLRELNANAGDLQERIPGYVPRFGSSRNPVDIGGATYETQYRGALAQAICDSDADGVLVSTCPTAMTNVPAVADVIVELHRRYESLNKPILAELQGGAECQEAILKLRAAGIPSYPTQGRAVSAFVGLGRYAQIQQARSHVAEAAFRASPKEMAQELVPMP
jgi:acyl-CoA synthetase (NDP forming)